MSYITCVIYYSCHILLVSYITHRTVYILNSNATVYMPNCHILLTALLCNSLRRFVTQLLKKIIFFVGDDQYNGEGKHGDPLEMDFVIKDRERQKLLREQHILKQVVYL